MLYTTPNDLVTTPFTEYERSREVSLVYLRANHLSSRVSSLLRSMSQCYHGLETALVLLIILHTIYKAGILSMDSIHTLSPKLLQGSFLQPHGPPNLPRSPYLWEIGVERSRACYTCLMVSAKGEGGKTLGRPRVPQPLREHARAVPRESKGDASRQVHAVVQVAPRGRVEVSYRYASVAGRVPEANSLKTSLLGSFWVSGCVEKYPLKAGLPLVRASRKSGLWCCRFLGNPLS